MWPFTRKEDWEKSQEELDADVRGIAQAGRADVHNQLITAETGANLPPGARDLWRSTPPGQRADLGLPPGTAMASVPNTPPPDAQGAMGGRPPGATPTTDTSRPPPDMSNRPGGMVAQLLGNANEMKFSRNDNGQIVQVTKHIHDDRPPSPISAGTSDLQPPAGTTSGPMRIGTPPGSVYDTLLADGPPGTVKTSLPTGLPPNARNTALNISGPPPNQLSSAVQKERQYNADQAARTEIWNKQMEENRVLPGETQEAARRRRTQEKADQLRREQMASSERIAKSQGEALAARYSIPAEAGVRRAEIGAQAKTESAATTSESNLEAARIRAQTWKDVSAAQNITREQVAAMNREANANKNVITLPNNTKVIRAGQNLIYADGVNAGQPYYEHKSGNSMLDELILMGMSPEDRAKFAQNRTQPAPAAAAGTPPRPDAKQAPDGKWYISDPNRPGKYLQVT